MKKSELRQIIREEIQKLFESYTVTVKKTNSKYKQGNKALKVYEKKSFNNEKEAKQFIKKMIKKYKLQKHAGHIVNYSGDYELFTNF